MVCRLWLCDLFRSFVIMYVFGSPGSAHSRLLHAIITDGQKENDEITIHIDGGRSIKYQGSSLLFFVLVACKTFSQLNIIIYISSSFQKHYYKEPALKESDRVYKRHSEWRQTMHCFSGLDWTKRAMDRLNALQLHNYRNW